MKSLYIDENGFLFHICTNERFGVGLIKSPGLAEELYSRFEAQIVNLILNENFSRSWNFDPKPKDSFLMIWGSRSDLMKPVKSKTIKQQKIFISWESIISLELMLNLTFKISEKVKKIELFRNER